MSSLSWRAGCTALILLASWGCQGESDVQQNKRTSPSQPGADGSSLPSPGDMGHLGDADVPTDPLNHSVFEHLRSHCALCHGQGTSWPAFDSLPSFENLLVYNPRWITPGDPSTSKLLPMLRGQGEGSLKQMPLGSDDFQALEAKGKTTITLSQLEAWIAQLRPRQTTTPSAIPTLRFKRAEQVVQSLYDQLGLLPQDFWGDVSPHVLDSPNAQRYPVAIPDTFAVRHDDAGLSVGRWVALGGGSHLEQLRATQTPTIARAMALTQISQSWCRVALTKPGNTALMRFVGLEDTQETGGQKIAQNIDYLHLRMLGEAATEVERQDLTALLAHYATAQGGMITGWIAVCSALIRDPRWITY